MSDVCVFALPRLRVCQVSCSADDLAALAPGGVAWEGVRNYGARNALRQMRVGDRCLLQHTGGKAPAVVATLRVVRAPYAEEAQFDANGPCAPARPEDRRLAEAAACE